MMRRRSAGVEDFDLVRSEQQNTVCHGFEIVEQLHSRYVELFRQRRAIDHPREVGRLRMVLKDGAGDAKTSRVDFLQCFLWSFRLWLGSVACFGCEFVDGCRGLRRNEKFSEHVLERGVLGTVERL